MALPDRFQSVVKLPAVVGDVVSVTDTAVRVRTEFGSIEAVDPRTPGRSLRPQVGERWLLTQNSGRYELHSVLVAYPPTVEGSRSDGTALASLLSSLASLGLIVDESTE